MCNHQWKKINDIKVCTRCGLTITYDGKIMFDRKLPNYRKGARKCQEQNHKHYLHI